MKRSWKYILFATLLFLPRGVGSQPHTAGTWAWKPFPAGQSSVGGDD